MAIGRIVTTEGVEELSIGLRDLSTQMQRRWMRQCLTAAAAVVRQAMRKHARQRSKVDTGALAKSIGSVVRTSRRTGITTVYVGPRTNYEIDGEVKDRRKGRRGKTRRVHRVPRRYAHLLEFGAQAHIQTIPVKRKDGTVVHVGIEHPGHDPEPFARPAYDESRHAAVAAFHAKLDQLLTRQQWKQPRKRPRGQ